MDFAFDAVRYLAAKQSVDDRALNRVVLEWLRGALAADGEAAPRVLELGAGIGTMPLRLFRWGVLPRAHYTLVDGDAASLAAARRQLAVGAAAEPPCPYELAFVQRDLLEYLALPETAAACDLIVGNAVLDLIDLQAVLPLLWRALAPGRPFWFSINFDGETAFLPELELDRQVFALYHRSMDERVRDGRRAGHSQTGRRLLELIPATYARIECAGSSDWVVWPRGGAYPGDEAYFLHCIVHTIAAELHAHPELDAAAFRAWVEARHQQIRQGVLCYVAHQLDVAGLSPGA